jgi:hypothetical protein
VPVIALSELKLLTLSGVAVERLLPSKASKMKPRQDALQTTFSDMDRMRRSAPVRVRGGGYHAEWYRYRDRQSP